MINKVTITGADNSIQPADLLALQQEFSFAEFALLASKKRIGTPRYPERDWLLELRDIKTSHPELNLALHICGDYVYQLPKGNIDVFMDYWYLVRHCNRIQINSHSIGADETISLFETLRSIRTLPETQFIFQYSESNRAVLYLADSYRIDAACLFDNSGGRGILATDIYEPLDGISCGYAGGLSPENLREQILRIEEKAGQTPVWIDMETHVRSDDDKQFDLAKVRACLEIASEFVVQHV